MGNKDRTFLGHGLFIIISIVMLFIIDNINNILAHAFAALFSVIIAIMIFITGWNTRNYTKNQFQFRHLLHNGEIRDVEVYIVPIVEDERVLLYSTIFDITERLKVERELKASETRAKHAAEIAELGYYEYYNNGNVWYSDELYRILGLSAEDGVLSLSEFLALVHPADYQELAENIRKSFFENTVLSATFRLVLPGNTQKYIYINNKKKILDVNGNLIKTVGIMHDITDLTLHSKQSESLADILNISKNEVYVFARSSYKILYVNKSAINNCGYCREEFMTMTPRDILVEYDFKKACNEFLTLKGTDKDGYIMTDAVHRRKDGSTYEVEAILQNCVYNGQDALVVILLDVTERNLLNTRLRQGEKMSALGQLVGGVAHDFNNALGGILGGAELLEFKSSQQDESTKEILSDIICAAKHAAGLTRQLLAFSRQNKVEKHNIELNETISGPLQILKKIIDPKIIIQEDYSAEVMTVNVDPAQLQSVILNLCTNAKDALKNTVNPRMVITSKIINDAEEDLPAAHKLLDIVIKYAAVTVANNEPHIPQEIQEKILEPFYTTKVEGKGTGLGLAMVYSIVRDSAGQLFIGSEEGGITAFTFYLPLVEFEESGSVATENTITKCSGRILIVEDDYTIRILLTQAVAVFGYQAV